MYKYRNHVKYTLASLIIAIGILSFFLQLFRAINSGFFIISSIVLISYFTNQSTILIFLIALFTLLKIEKSWYQKLAFISFINIIMTGVIFHIFLKDYFTDLALIQILLHTVNPIIYSIFYLFYFDNHVTKFKSYIGLYYPIIYFIFVQFLFYPLMKNMIILYYPDSPNMPYVYPFLNPNNYQYHYLGMLLYAIIFLIIIYVSSLILLLLKQKLDLKLHKNKNA